ncbi:MAG TPA: 4a-hydroxytetrahydrobiopterin dehydratase [Nitrososphaerales archaeon]|nr:4a-hydroxytetrahydrobiopterin dehydratase [Nitrososphaerales archaeon]
MTREESENYLKQVDNWTLVDNSIMKKFKLKDFVGAINFVNKIADVAEGEQHHPDILVYGWHKVKVILFTQVINGLSENDFILAAKFDKSI